MNERIRVRLTVDLTEYKPGLVAGSEGYTVGAFGLWSRTFDRFVGVNFPGIGTLDVLWKSLEIIDEEYLKEMEKQKNNQLEELKSARNVIKFIGPKGGFRYISYEYTDKNGVNVSTSNGFKQDSEKLLKIFADYNIPVEVKQIK